MQTRREYLVKLGLAKDGRGKLSNAAHEAIAKAVAEGVEFSDLQARPVVVKRATDESSPVQVQETTNNYAEEARRYPSDQMFEGTDSQGKTHRMDARQGCYNSPYSIAGCFACATEHRALVSTGKSMEWISVTQIRG